MMKNTLVLAALFVSMTSAFYAGAMARETKQHVVTDIRRGRMEETMVCLPNNLSFVTDQDLGFVPYKQQKMLLVGMEHDSDKYQSVFMIGGHGQVYKRSRDYNDFDFERETPEQMYIENEFGMSFDDVDVPFGSILSSLRKQCLKGFFGDDTVKSSIFEILRMSRTCVAQKVFNQDDQVLKKTLILSEDLTVNSAGFAYKTDDMVVALELHLTTTDEFMDLRENGQIEEHMTVCVYRIIQGKLELLRSLQVPEKRYSFLPHTLAFDLDSKTLMCPIFDSKEGRYGLYVVRFNDVIIDFSQRSKDTFADVLFVHQK